MVPLVPGKDFQRVLPAKRRTRIRRHVEITPSAAKLLCLSPPPFVQGGEFGVCQADDTRKASRQVCCANAIVARRVFLSTLSIRYAHSSRMYFICLHWHLSCSVEIETGYYVESPSMLIYKSRPEQSRGSLMVTAAWPARGERIISDLRPKLQPVISRLGRLSNRSAYRHSVRGNRWRCEITHNLVAGIRLFLALPLQGISTLTCLVPRPPIKLPGQPGWRSVSCCMVTDLKRLGCNLRTPMAILSVWNAMVRGTCRRMQRVWKPAFSL